MICTVLLYDNELGISIPVYWRRKGAVVPFHATNYRAILLTRNPIPVPRVAEKNRLSQTAWLHKVSLHNSGGFKFLFAIAARHASSIKAGRQGRIDTKFLPALFKLLGSHLLQHINCSHFAVVDTKRSLAVSVLHRNFSTCLGTNIPNLRSFLLKWEMHPNSDAWNACLHIKSWQLVWQEGFHNSKTPAEKRRLVEAYSW